MLYSIDKVKIKFMYLKATSVQMFLDKLEIDTLVTSCYSSNKITKCKHNFLYGEDVTGGAVYVGVVPNWEKEERGDKNIVLEYNPNKVDPFLIPNLEWLKNVPLAVWRVMSFDIAVDIQVPYNTVVMLKRDPREYMCQIGHREIETRYLGAFGENGHIKLYNKALEQKINVDWTRFEITIKDIDDISVSFEAFCDVVKLPVLYRVDTQLSVSYSSLSAVWRLAIDTVINDANKLYDIQNFKTRKKMEQLLFECLETVPLSLNDMYKAYSHCFTHIVESDDSKHIDVARILYLQNARFKF